MSFKFARGTFKSKLRRYLSATLILCMVYVGAMSFISGEDVLRPELRSKAIAVASDLSGQISNAIKLGVPLNQLVGVEALFESALANNEDINSLELISVDGDEISLRSKSGLWNQSDEEFSESIVVNNVVVGTVKVRPDQLHYQRLQFAIIADLAIVLLIVLLVAFELQDFFFGRRLIGEIEAVEDRSHRLYNGELGGLEKLHSTSKVGLEIGAFDDYIYTIAEKARKYKISLDAAAQTSKEVIQTSVLKASNAMGFGSKSQKSRDTFKIIRAPLFLFMLSFEMTRPFFFFFINDLAKGVGPFSASLTVGLVLSGFIIIVALLQLPMGHITHRIGRGNSMMVGSMISSGGFLIAALSPNIEIFIIGYFLAAVGFSFVTVSSQGHILDSTKPGTPARLEGLELMIAAIHVGAICGESFGGILSEQFGFRTALYAIATIAFISFIVSAVQFRNRDVDIAPKSIALEKKEKRKIMWKLLTDSKLMSLYIGIALPSKLLLTALCFYLVPMFMLSEGATTSEIARTQFVHPIASVLFAGYFTRKSIEKGSILPFLLFGTLLASIGMFVANLGSNAYVIYLVLITFGVAQAMTIAPQGALVGKYAFDIDFPEDQRHFVQIEAYALYRIFERIGAALGPIYGGLILATQGFSGAVIGLGVISVVGMLTFILIDYLNKSVRLINE